MLHGDRERGQLCTEGVKDQRGIQLDCKLGRAGTTHRDSHFRQRTGSNQPFGMQASVKESKKQGQVLHMSTCMAMRIRSAWCILTSAVVLDIVKAMLLILGRKVI